MRPEWSRPQDRGHSVGTARDRGSATLLLVMLVGLCLLLAGAGLGIARIALARVQVASAADLAALAGSENLDCAVARAVAQANGADLLDCTVHGDDLVVRVGLGITLAGRLLHLSAQARAGPP